MSYDYRTDRHVDQSFRDNKAVVVYQSIDAGHAGGPITPVRVVRHPGTRKVLTIEVKGRDALGDTAWTAASDADAGKLLALALFNDWELRQRLSPMLAPEAPKQS